MNTVQETWVAIPEWEGFYEVSNYGRVRSLPRTVVRQDGKPLRVAGQVLSGRPNDRGYPRVTLMDGQRRGWNHVHSLVARAFLPQPPGEVGSRRGQFNVNHIDGVKTNNRVSNLEWVTVTENYRHAIRTGLLSHHGAANGRAKVTDEQAQEIRRLYQAGARQVDLAERFGICQTSISRIVRGAGWANLGPVRGHSRVQP